MPAKAGPLNETETVPLPRDVPFGTIEVKPTCGLDVAAHGSEGNAVYAPKRVSAEVTTAGRFPEFTKIRSIPKRWFAANLLTFTV